MTKARTLGGLDVVALFFVGIAIAGLWAVQFLVVPSFAAMFTDFGGPSLPALTRWATSPVIASFATLVSALLVAVGLAVRLARGGSVGTASIAFAAVLPAIAIAVIFYAMYLPIFQLAGAIRAE